MLKPSIHAPSTPQEWSDYYDLRWRILRQPWQQPRGSERDELEDQAVHLALFDEHNKPLAIGRLHLTDTETAQIRYMAVESGYEGKGYGKMILSALEQCALEKKLERVILNARSPVVGFYDKQGYRIIGKAHTLFDSIEHYRMEKTLLSPNEK